MHNPDLDFRHPTPPPPPTPPTPPPPPPLPTQPHYYPNVVVSVPTAVPFASSSSTSFNFPESSNAPQPHQQNPRKKRSKLMRPDADNPAKRPKSAKKPDPAAPKITTPCSECGRKFWSWKALFGHMRCHPERHWRGIQPPPDFQRTGSPPNPVELSMSEDDHDAASSLLILASGTDQTQLPGTSSQGLRENDPGGCRFECSSCKKVFGSHQALGGHRASHKNVKGCFAITKSDVEVDEELHHHHHHLQHGNVVMASRSCGVDDSNVDDVMEENNKMVMAVESGHQCSICWRVFSSGQALGGHKRCHWEKGEEASVVMTQLGISNNTNSGGLDLNLPAAAAAPTPATEDDQSSSHTSPGLALDLRLGL